VQILVDRLSGLCESHEREETLHIREVVFVRPTEIIEKEKSSGSIPESELRVQCTTIDIVGEEAKPDKKTWSLHYQGLYIQDNSILAAARPVIEVEVSDSIEAFLEEMGYTYRYEFSKQGVRFHALPDQPKLNPLYVTVFGYMRLSDKTKRNDEHTEPLIREWWVVELIGYALHPDLEDMAKELHSFANRLIPIVNLIKLDKATSQVHANASMVNKNKQEKEKRERELKIQEAQKQKEQQETQQAQEGEDMEGDEDESDEDEDDKDDE